MRCKHIRRAVLSFAVVLLAAIGAPSKAEMPAPQRTRLMDLPLAAQAAISTTLGQEDPAYHAVRVSAGWMMRNPGQGVTATFGSDRIVVGTGVGTDTVEWGLHLRVYGRGDSVTPVPAVMPERAANRMVDANGVRAAPTRQQLRKRARSARRMNECQPIAAVRSDACPSSC